MKEEEMVDKIYAYCLMQSGISEDKLKEKADLYHEGILLTCLQIQDFIGTNGRQRIKLVRD